jgi:hypothetical protein
VGTRQGGVGKANAAISNWKFENLTPDCLESLQSITSGIFETAHRISSGAVYRHLKIADRVYTNWRRLAGSWPRSASRS